ncbi:MAG TPA: hypothetical protein VFQ54_06185 [Thermomicrobiales bacterium]|nr:hypothetical protein [Thermomicrobiales bacterium]
MSKNIAEKAETMVRTYTATKDYSKDAKQLAKEGWRVAEVTRHERRRGCMRILMMGVIFAWIYPPKPEIIVRYERAILNKGFARCYSCGTINRIPKFERGQPHVFTCSNCGAELRD